jgi:hypothetical protein
MLVQIEEEEHHFASIMDSVAATINSDEQTAVRQFYKRHNKVLLDKYALDAQKQALLTENRNLKAILKQYLEGVSVSETILAKDNSLLIVNGRANIPYAY